jgi:hypothetical protein
MATYRRSGKDPAIEITSDKKEEKTRTSAQGPIHDDTLCFVDKGVSYQWGEIYQMFQHEFYPLLDDDQDLGVYQIIRHLRLHKVVSHATIFPCVEVVSLIIYQANVDN